MLGVRINEKISLDETEPNQDTPTIPKHCETRVSEERKTLTCYSIPVLSVHDTHGEGEHATTAIVGVMSLSPFIRRLPYGRWALSVAVLMGGFFWARSVETWGDCGERKRRRREGQGEEEGAEDETKESSAYQTDQEVHTMYLVVVVPCVVCTSRFLK